MAEPCENGASEETENRLMADGGQDIMEQRRFAERPRRLDDDLEREKDKGEADEDAPQIVRAEFARRAEDDIAEEEQDRRQPND